MSERNLKPTLVKLLKQHHLLSVSEILDKLGAQGKTYNKTSVYRALEGLLEQGILCRQYFDQAEAKFELREDHHIHLVCEDCGRVESAECDYRQPTNLKGFTIDHHHLTLMGHCPKCQ